MAVKFKRKINKTWVVLGVSLVIGLIAAVMAQSFLSKKLQEIQDREKSRSQVSLVVPKYNLEKGATLSPDNVAVRPFPKEFAPAEAITPDQFSRATGSVLAHPLNGGEAIMWSHLEPKRDPNFSARLQPGRRAVTVPVDSISSISGMVQPGDVIDLVVSIRDEPPPEKDGQQQSNAQGELRTFTLLQSVTVLATGEYTEPGNDEGRGRSYSTITVDVSPEDAKKVVAARNVAKITAFLRAPTDEEAVSMEKTKDLYLLGLKPQTTPVPPPKFDIEVLAPGQKPQFKLTDANNGNFTYKASESSPPPKIINAEQDKTKQEAEALVTAVEKVIDARTNSTPPPPTPSPATKQNEPSSNSGTGKNSLRLVD